MHRTRHMAGWGGSTFWLMTGVVACLWLSGWVMYGLPVEDLPDMSATLATLRRVSGVVHGSVAWLFCVLCGRGVWPHVRVMWHRHALQGKWVWGLFNLLLFLFLTLGGLVLLYGTPWMHDGLSHWHFWAGAVVPASYGLHTRRRWWPFKASSV